MLIHTYIHTSRLTECVYVVEGEPTVPEALAATQFAVERRCDAVLAIGSKQIPCFMTNNVQNISLYLRELV